MSAFLLLRWILAALHVLALGVGLGAVWVRSTALRGPLDSFGIQRVLRADGWWGIAALLWLGTGLWRLIGGYEKATDYYLHNHVFWTKMIVFLVILLLELRPMLALIEWRRRLAAGQAPDLSRAPQLARISRIEAYLVIAMVLAATAMARGIGA